MLVTRLSSTANSDFRRRLKREASTTRASDTSVVRSATNPKVEPMSQHNNGGERTVLDLTCDQIDASPKPESVSRSPEVCVPSPGSCPSVPNTRSHSRNDNVKNERTAAGLDDSATRPLLLPLLEPPSEFLDRGSIPPLDDGST